MELIFEVYPGQKGEKKHSRRYECKTDKSPIKDIYVSREFSNGKDQLKIELNEFK